MKFHFRKLLFLALAICFLASCNSDEETPAPTITLLNPPAQTADKGATVNFVIKAVAQEKIDKITITQKIGSSTTTVSGYPKTSGFQSATEDLFNFNYEVTEASGKIELSFSVTDKKGKIAATSFEITVNAAVAMTEFKTGAIVNNKDGAQMGSYNLITGTTVSSSDANRHIQDAGIDASLPAASNWKKQWIGVNGTDFVMVSGSELTYANATKEAVVAAYNAGSKVTTTPALSVGNVLIAKNGDNYFIIEITAVTNTTNDNNDKIEFKYKK